MKIRIATLLLALWAVPALAAADDLQMVIKEREAVLTKLVALVEARHAAGDASEADLFEARMKLLKFRSEVAKDPADKLSIQEGIVKQAEENEGKVMERHKAGMALEMDLLFAKDRTLQEKQILLALRAAKP